MSIKNYEEFFVGNAAPVQRPDLVKLSDICYNIYSDKEPIIKNDNFDINKIKHLYEEYNRQAEEFLKINIQFF